MDSVHMTTALAVRSDLDPGRICQNYGRGVYWGSEKYGYHPKNVASVITLRITITLKGY